MQWYGDVEIHWYEQDWNHHKHNSDRNYNKVVVHVIYYADNTTHKRVYRQDGTLIHTLHLKPFLDRPLQEFLERYKQSKSLPCASHVSFISQKAFHQQLVKAQEKYFEQKVNDLSWFYDPSLPPSRAWIKLLAMGLFDGLGIAHNREPMKWLCGKLLSSLDDFSSCQELTNRALTQWGPEGSVAGSHPDWKHKNCRPANHPNIRIRQACECLWHIGGIPFAHWLKKDGSQLWNELIEQIQTKPGLGKERADILFGTVWLPSFYILGNLFSSKQLQSYAYSGWMKHKAKLPSSLLKPFSSLNIPPSTYQYNLGTVYQLRSYCKPRRCVRCKVFKNVISS